MLHRSIMLADTLSCSRMIQSYMGDRPHIARDYLAEDVINFSIERADFRDELYLQLMKVRDLQ